MKPFGVFTSSWSDLDAAPEQGWDALLDWLSQGWKSAKSSA
jgi:hypothetical protein